MVGQNNTKRSSYFRCAGEVARSFVLEMLHSRTASRMVEGNSAKVAKIVLFDVTCPKDDAKVGVNADARVKCETGA